MNTNTASNDASPTNTTDLNTHNNISTPNRSNVVSQSQGSGGIEALIEATVRTSNGVFTPTVERALDSLEVNLYDENLHSQVPADAIARIDPGVMPETRSPGKRDLFMSFETARKKRKGDGAALRQTNYQASRSSLQRAFPFDTMCTFLRDATIDIKVAELKSKPLRMTTTMGAALNFWQQKRNISRYPDVMVGIQSILESAPHPLGPFMRRLFLEDYMMLEPGNDVICRK